MIDIRGIRINVGDVVAYPGRHGSHCWLNIGTVTEVTDSSYDKNGNLTKYLQVNPKRGSDLTPPKVRISRVDRVVVVQKANQYVVNHD